jgi:hypothetical protein
MNGDSDDDNDVSVTIPGSNGVISPTSSKLEQDPGSNEFVNVVPPDEEELAARGHEVKARTLSVEESPKPVQDVPKPKSKSIENTAEKASPIDNDSSTNASIFTNEMPLQLEPESMTETERKRPPGFREEGEDEDGPQMPGSFDLSTAHPQVQISWAEMLKKLHL